MADNLVFPIGFDLEEAVKKAGQEWNSTYADKLEKLLAKRAITVNLGFSTKNLNNLDDVKRRLAELKIEPLTPENKTAIRELVRELKELARIMEKIQKFKGIELPELQMAKAAKLRKDVAQADEKLRLSKERVRQAEERLILSQQRAAQQANRTSKAFSDQGGYLERLIKRMAIYASFSMVGNFLTSVREVTAQFELQRVSLGAILQDANKGAQTFSQIKQFALKSPISILDLTKYTKQLAAYKFETEELFDWTKRLTDISVGLSVPMERIVLLAGQVRATGFLRGCLGKGTIVVMLDGSKKKVEDIEVGDVVMGDDERGRNVLSLIHNREMMYVVKYDSGTFRCNENHILTVFNQETNQVEDVYILECLRSAHKHKGIRRINSHYEYFDMTIERDCVDDYYGFEIDGNKRFIIEDNIVTHNSEVRQATEAGIPLVEELAAKLTKMNGEMVTAAEVMDMISKRAISWEMVADIFKDMTSAGGTFYNMQEKQGNTLFGLWAKLGDAASVMYEEIGNTDDVDKGMKNAIQLLTELMRNWKAVANTAAWVVAPTALTAMFTKYALSSTRKQAADAAATAATERRKAAVLQLSRAIEKGSVDDIKAANATLQKAKADEIAAQKAATKTGLMASGFKSIASSMAMGLGIGLAVTAVTALAYKLFEAYENAHRLKNKLKEIDAERIIVTEQSVRNFEYLADAAIKAADGSKEQKDKLDELHRTFKDMIPVEDMSIENLRKLRSGADSAAEGYKSLTESIRNYIAQQQKQKALGAIEEEFGAKRITAMKNLYDWFDKQGLGVEERTRFFAEFEKQAQDTSKSLKEQIVAAFNEAGIEGGEELANSIAEEKGFWNKALEWFGKNQPLMFGTTAIAYKAVFPKDGYINDLANATRKYNEEVSGTLSYYEGLEGTLGKYTKAMEDAKKHMADFIPQGFKSDTFAYQQEVNAEQIRTWGGVIVDALKAENIKIENEWFNIDNDKAFNIADIATINIQAIKDALGSGHGDIKKLLDNIAKGYNEIVPKDAVVRSVRSKFEELADSMGLIDKVRGNMMGATEGLEAYRKKINDTAKDYAKQVENLTKVLAATPVISLEYKEIADKLENAKNLEEFYSKMAEILGKSTSGGGRQSDPRLQILNDIANKMAQINKEYDDLLKKEGQTKALADTQKLFASSFADMRKVADKYKFKLPAFEVPQTIEDVQKWYDAIIKEINRLGIKNADKILIELGFKRDKSAIDKQQREIEAELKRLSDRISRTKTAKEFYEKILGMTGDVELAANVSLQIYGSTGKELSEQIKEQFRLAFATLDKPDAKVSAKIGDLIDKGRFEELRDYIALLPEAQRKAAEDLVKAQQQMSVKQYEQWLKDLEKAKDYADKRIELSRYTANQIAAIEERIAKLDPAASDYEQQKAMLEKLIAGYKSREDKMGSELEYEQFKNSALYVQVFENLDNASKTALENMRNRLLALKDQWKNLSPEKVKELTKRLEELDAQIAQRNPFKSIADSIKKLREMRMGGRTKESDAQIAFDAEADRQTAEAKMLADEKAYEAAVKQYGVESDIAKEKRKIADDSADAYRKAEQMADSAAENADEWEEVAEAINAANQKLDKYQEQINEALGGIRKIMESFGASAEDMQFFDDVTNGFNEIFDAGQQGAAAYADFMQGNFVGAATKGISAVGSLISGVTNLFYAGRVKRANKEIKRQQQLLEQLQYTYSRLEYAADKAFGSDYVNNYQQQIKNLQAQQQAYLKQAQAERSKGKKADEEKIKEYENQARDTADEIKKMQDELVAHFTGSSKTDIARQMAKSWIDARASMSDTFAAIKGDYADMVKNMLVEGAAARVIENALSPVWDSMDRMLKQNNVQGAINSLIGGMDSALNAANNGMEVLWKALEARGYDMKQLISDTDSEYTGIAKSVAGATSEEINNVAAIGNTLMYYVSPIPRIDENLARVVAIMEGRGAALPQTTSAGWTDWQQQAMDNYNAIARNTADTVVECRRAAEACERIASTFKVKGSTKGLNVFLNS